MTPRIKHLWTSLAFNAAAALLNAVLVARSINNGSWLWLLNGVALAMSLYMIHWCWLRIKKVTQEEKDRVMDILSEKMY